MKAHNPRIVCKDGFSISVQARESAYCTPRNDHGPYTKVECGYPSSVPISERLKEFAELFGTDEYTETVYAYVPVEVVQEELELHGGIVEGRLPE
jgi:hypothetical protein